jgi:hypothetical protein
MNQRTGRNPYDNRMISAQNGGMRGMEVPFSDNVVQSNIFNNELEMQDITVHGYLNKFCHDIITFKMCEKIIDQWTCGRVEWHIERGLKLQADGTAL